MCKGTRPSGLRQSQMVGEVLRGRQAWDRKDPHGDTYVTLRCRTIPTAAAAGLEDRETWPWIPASAGGSGQDASSSQLQSSVWGGHPSSLYPDGLRRD